jgi:hypothetical protein
MGSASTAGVLTGAGKTAFLLRSFDSMSEDGQEVCSSR